MWGNPTDEALLAGLESGDKSAATAFVRRFQSRVYGLAWTLVRDQALAEEISQEAFLRAWRHAGAYDSRRGRVATWLLAITRNLALDRLRVRRTEPIDPARIAETLYASVRDSGDDQIAGVSEPIKAALMALPVDQRRALVMAALIGCTARQISEIEDVPIGTVKTRIRTATIKLRDDLEARDEL
ncbi:sigma-70 family RNA polymerase sigma factor [soil metagenome]